MAAFVAGVISFLSPCVLPLVPGYVSLISGVGVEELKADDRKLRSALLFNSLMFVIGFSLVFISFGAVASGVGQLLLAYKRHLTYAAGVIVILFGLHLTGVLKIKALYADKRLHALKGSATPLGAFVMGFAFAFGWTPCVGPILAVILGFAAAEASLMKGVLLLAIYSAGLAVPFLITSLGIERFLRFYGGFRRHLRTVEVISGVLLITIGVLIFLRKFTILSGYLAFLNRFAL